jgi:hypothetical protein
MSKDLSIQHHQPTSCLIDHASWVTRAAARREHYLSLHVVQANRFSYFYTKLRGKIF